MTQRVANVLTWLVALTTLIWVILLMYSALLFPPANTIGERAVQVESKGWLHFASYANAALITILTSAMLSTYYVLLREKYPALTVLGVVFVPMYGVLNLVVYLSQIFIVPELIQLRLSNPDLNYVDIILGLFFQDWPGSLMMFLNSLAYAVLGIPLIVFGLLFLRGSLAGAGKLFHWGGMFFLVSGGFSILALVGLGVHSQVLANLTLVSGVVFLVGLLLLGTGFLRSSAQMTNARAV